MRPLVLRSRGCGSHKQRQCPYREAPRSSPGPCATWGQRGYVKTQAPVTAQDGGCAKQDTWRPGPRPAQAVRGVRCLDCGPCYSSLGRRGQGRSTSVTTTVLLLTSMGTCAFKVASLNTKSPPGYISKFSFRLQQRVSYVCQAGAHPPV